MDKIQKLKKRLGMAENALMRIDSLFNDSDRPSQIVSEYFEKVNEWWFDTENTTSNIDYPKCKHKHRAWTGRPLSMICLNCGEALEHC